jgi:membrane associated rhomboid family serine protease
MLFGVISLSIWFFVLFMARPMPNDLRAKIPTYWESFRQIQATFWLGFVLIFIFFLTVGVNSYEIQEYWLDLLGVNNLTFLSLQYFPWWLVQSCTHIFMHMDFRHLLLNVSLLGVLSLYERRVKALRFLLVFCVSGVLSSISVFFFSEPTVAIGASSGLSGLLAAYFFDDLQITFKEYCLGFFTLAFLFWIMQFDLTQSTAYTIDTYGHIFGFIISAIFCRLFPQVTLKNA